MRRWRRRRRQYERAPGRHDVQRRRPHRPVRGAAEDDFDGRRADKLRDFRYGIGRAVDDVRYTDGLQVRLVVQRCRRDDGREAGELCELNGYCETSRLMPYLLCVEVNNLRSPYCPTEVDPPKMTIGWPLYRPLPAASQGGVSFLDPGSTLSA